MTRGEPRGTTGGGVDPVENFGAGFASSSIATPKSSTGLTALGQLVV